MFRVTPAVFHTNRTETLIAVGGARDLTLGPRKCTVGLLILYRISEDGSRLELVHKVSLLENKKGCFFY